MWRSFPPKGCWLAMNAALSKSRMCLIRFTTSCCLNSGKAAFEYAKPLRQWRQDWPACSHLLLRRLREQWPEGRGVKEFVQVLRLHQQYPARLLEQAVEQALSYGCAHVDGVKHCLEHLGEQADRAPLLDLSDKPHLALVGNQPLDLGRYDQLIERYAQL